MDNYFKTIGDFSDVYSCLDYKTDPNYDKNLDINYNLKISREDLGTEKEIKLDEETEELVCQKNCKKCKKETDKILNLLENNCGELEKRKKSIKINIPREIKDGQSLRLIKEGKKNNNKYGNLIVTINIK